MHTIERPREVTPKPRGRRMVRRLGLAAMIGLAVPVAALAFDSLNVDVPFLPAVGESVVGATTTLTTSVWTDTFTSVRVLLGP